MLPRQLELSLAISRGRSPKSSDGISRHRPGALTDLDSDVDSDFPCVSVAKILPANAGRSLGWEDALEEEMAAHSRILAWRTPRTEEPGGL